MDEFFDKNFKAIIFCKTRDDVDKIYEKITELGYSCSRYHSGMDAEEKNKAFDDFLKGVKRVMIATDGMARGINIT